MELFLASWQTLTGLAWLAGRIARGFGGYYADAAMGSGHRTRRVRRE
jgi:hypothetical protein